MSTTVETLPGAAQGHASAAARALGTSAGDAGGSDAGQLPFALAIFVSAFLVFQVQLLLGKVILPVFGGAPAVWTVCIFVFQLLFLAGYGYSHGLATWLPVRKQVIAHSVLLGVSAIFIALAAYLRSAPLGVGANWQPEAWNDPTWAIMKFLIAAIGLPFFLLSATSPLMQHWFAQAGPKRLPYRLYALSNAGSLLGLLSYPFLVEPYVGLGTQRWAWVAGYGLFLGCYSFSARSVARSAAPSPPKPEFVREPFWRARPDERRVGWPLRLLWMGLAACASVLLLATTNLVCQDIPVSPFLWVLQLGLYLLSFILCFESDRWYRREIFYPAFAVTVAFVILVSLPSMTYSFMMQLAAYSAALFTGCMVCHGEAARTRPRAELLTAFYFYIATGGALGGIAVSLLAPRIFPNYWEYPLGVLGCIAVVLGVSMREDSSWWYKGRASLALVIFAGAVWLAPPVIAPLWREAARLPRSASLYAAAILIGAAAWRYAAGAPSAADGAVAGFGPQRVEGRAGIAHRRPADSAEGGALPRDRVVPKFLRRAVGDQRRAGELSGLAVRRHHSWLPVSRCARARLATGYYGPFSGANMVIRNWPQHPMRVGLVGMGVGTLAALAHAGDVFRFYEINPDVYKLSAPATAGQQPYFTYLRDSPGRIEVVLGDARLSLEREASRGDFQKFDVLVLDAFSSDAIPMHLLTREAFQVYAKHLRGPGSVIAVHISNQTLDLRPVIAGIARDFGFHAVRVDLLPTGPFSQSDWILLSRDPASLSGQELLRGSEPFPAETQADLLDRRLLQSAQGDALEGLGDNC